MERIKELERDLIELLKAFGLFVSCLVIGYGGLFLFFY